VNIVVEYQGHLYFVLTVVLCIALYAYIYHLYTAKKDAEGVDYEKYSNMALNDDIDDIPVKSVSDTKEK